MRKVWLCIFYALCIFTIVFSLFWICLLYTSDAADEL